MEIGDELYLVMANEGDARDYDNFSEEIRGADLSDEGFSFMGGLGLILNDKKLGRLRTTTAPPEEAIVGVDHDGRPVLDGVVAFGGRSFSIRRASSGELVFDSGDQFEQITLATYPEFFNATNDDAEADDRSDDKGPEPEGVAVAEIGGVPYAFIGLERIGGVMVYDISDPTEPEFVTYQNTRLPADHPGVNTVDDDLGPESMTFIAASDSPSGDPLLVVTHEVSGSTVIFRVVE